MSTKQPAIIVVGAGIVGASLAYHLARRGACVTLLDSAPTPAQGATGQSFGWLTVGGPAAQAYTHLRQAALEDWHRLKAELRGQLPIHWSGALSWRDDPAQTESLWRARTQMDQLVRLVDQAELYQLEPNLKQAPPLAMWAPNEGALDPILTTNLLVNAARQAGASVQLGEAVLALITKGSRVTGAVTAKGNVGADWVVLAAGVQATALCQPLGLALPITVSPSLLMAFHQEHAFVKRIVSTPSMDLRAASASLSLAVGDYETASRDANPAVFGQRTLNEIQAHWQGTEHLQLVRARIGQRPIPQDGLPLLGQLPPIKGLYVAVMHAGVTLAALVGRLVASEIIDEEASRLLLPYRPDRG